MKCVGAWEEDDDNCAVDSDYDLECNQLFVTSSDALCKCQPLDHVSASIGLAKARAIEHEIAHALPMPKTPSVRVRQRHKEWNTNVDEEHPI